MSGFRILKVQASIRVPSRRAGSADYEILHATIQRYETPSVMEEVVFLRQGEGAPSCLIALEDLTVVQAEWTRFVSDVLRRHPELGGSEKPAAPGSPEISVSGGRHGVRGRMSLPGEPVISMGPKRRIGPPPDSPPAPPAGPETWHVLRFAISDPPSADDIVEAAKAHPRGLVVVAPAPVSARAEAFVSALKSGTESGLPTTFNALVIERRVAGRPVTHKQLRAEVAGALIRTSGDLNSVVWILPE